MDQAEAMEAAVEVQQDTAEVSISLACFGDDLFDEVAHLRCTDSLGADWSSMQLRHRSGKSGERSRDRGISLVGDGQW